MSEDCHNSDMTTVEFLRAICSRKFDTEPNLNPLDNPTQEDIIWAHSLGVKL